MRYYVIINGVNSLTIEGLAIRTLPPISKPAMRNLREEIDGRDGDITTELGYGAYDKTLEIGLFGDYDINKIIAFFNSKGKIIFSDEPDKYYNFEIVDKIDYTKLVKFRTATINIHCQPFKYPVSEEPQEEEYEYVEGTGENITLDNTAEAILNKIGILGNTKQTQYTGKNKSLFGNTTGNGITFDGNKITMVNPINYKFADTWNLKNDTSLSGKTFTIYARVNGTIQSNYIDLRVAKTGNGYAYMCKIDSSRQTTFKDYIAVNQITLGSNEVFTGVAVEVNGTPTANLEVDFMIVEGSYNAQTIGDYEPYVGGIPAPSPDYPQDIHVVSGNNTIEITGRNLLDLSIFSNESNYYEVEDNNVIVNAQDGRAYYNINYYLHLLAGTYTLMSKNQMPRTQIGNRDNNSFSINQYAKYVITFTLEKDTNVFIKFLGVGSFPFTIEKPMLLKGTHYSYDTDFEEYQSQSLPLNLGDLEMASIPNTDYKDVFVKDGDTWYKAEQIKKVILDGTESGWGVTGSGTPNWFYRLTYTTDLAPTDYAFSNYYILKNISSSNTNQGFGITGGYFRFRFGTEDTIENYKAWLGTHNVEIRYPVNTIQRIEITGTLAEQLEAIKNAVSYSGQTNVSQTNNDLPFILDLSALKEGSDHLVINNAGNIYAMPTMDIEGTGVVDIYLNDVQILEADLTETNNIVIDTEAMEAYNPDTNALANRQITGDYSKIKLEPGDNDLRFSGALSKATITDYTRWL